MNTTIRALNALLARGWSGKIAFGYVALLHKMGHFDILGRIARDESGSTAVDYAVQIVGVAIIMLSVLGTTELAIHAAWSQAQVGLTDTTPVKLCSGPLRQSPEGGSC